LAYTHQPRKRFGQHFLHDPEVIRRLVAAIDPQPGEHLVEIGPGTGALTAPLLRQAGELDVVELDRDLAATLTARCQGLGRLRVHAADALRFDFSSLASAGERLRIVGNLPYNISTPLLFHLLAKVDTVQEMVFMLQKEVVARMAADPGSRTYGRLSVMVQYRCDIERLFSIGPGAFTPPPKVDSAVVRLRPRPPAVAATDEKLFSEVVAHAFSQRRKTLRNALLGLTGEQAIRTAGIDPGCRAETLAVDDFVRLANALAPAA
jgi:16S rRNA (adenine1518-N6/adenine1519-N6)-dimethyltransferase